MSHESIIHGYIDGATWRSESYRLLQHRNLEVLAALPEEDEWPSLARGMFSAPETEPLRGTHRAQVIHFGGSFKYLESEHIGEWIVKFERLLARLSWFVAEVHIDVEIYGRYDFEWLAEFRPDPTQAEPPPFSIKERKVFHEGKPIEGDELRRHCGL